MRAMKGATRAGLWARLHAFKYFVASRLATPRSFSPRSFRNRRTRSGSRFDNSRSHQPIAF